MRTVRRAVGIGLAVIGLSATIGATSARAQTGTPGDGRSLGGYGGSMSGTGPDMGAAGPVIPYAGRFAGFMPARMGGGGSGLSFQTRAAPAMGTGRTPFHLTTPSGGMSSMSGGLGASPRPFSAFGMPGSTGLGGGMSSMSAPRGTGVMPPSFGYPFRQPPSLGSPSTAGAGMSM